MGNLPARPETGDIAVAGADQSEHQFSNVIRVRLPKEDADHVTLGLILEERDLAPHVIVADVIDGSPASRSGLIQPRDLLLKINAVDVRDEKLGVVLELLRSLEIGTPIALLVQCPEGFVAFLQTIFLPDGSPKTVRVTAPVGKTGRSLTSPGFGARKESPLEDPQKSGSNENPDGSTKSPTSIEALSEFLRVKVGLGARSPVEENGKSPAEGNALRCPQNDEGTRVKQNGTATSPGHSPKIVLTQCEKPRDSTMSNNIDSSAQQRSNNNSDGMVNQKEVAVAVVSSRAGETMTTTNAPDNNLSTERRPSGSGSLGTGRSPSASRRGSVCTPRRHQKLRYLVDESVTADTLHNLACSADGSVCEGSVCRGSLLATPTPRGPGEPRPVDELRAQAKDFIDQYYSSIKRLNTAAHHDRWQQVQEAIDKRGTYEQTTSELTFGAKTGWRNASRCIGRIQWSKLQVFDARHITTTHGMFEVLCNHIKYATNKGNIRSAITVFPPRSDRLHDYRVWNNLLIAYAAYRQPDGSIVGDPAQLKFTEVCERLGWKGQGGMFDVLPLVLQADGKDPELFTVPPDLVLEVHIVHPRYDWFADLGLRWYAVPAVSSMGLDCGGLEYTAIPFNGWYMGTEIGARDLCDQARYNLSEVVARKMELDVSRTSSLWRDQAILEVNIAVLHSYQSQRVTITDHHAASESFMKHLENEMRLRGGTPADWVWIVPPISGSACPVFHQEMLNYKLKPSYEYLEEPWKTHVWEKDRENGEVIRTRKKRTFKDIARAVNFSARLMGKALGRRIKCTILYATETGKSETFAKRLCQIFGHAFDPKVMSMDEYDVIHLEHETLVICVVSTFGNGDPPETGEEFAKELYSMMKPAQSSGSYIRMESLGSPKSASSFAADYVNPDDNLLLHTGPLSNVRFSVFGLGSTAYPKFCEYGKFVDRLMGDLGGERICELGTGDELCGQEQSFQMWAKAVFKAACETFCVGDDVNVVNATSSLLSTDCSWAPGKFRLSPAAGATAPDPCKVLSTIHHKRVRPCRTISRVYLQAKESDRQTILIRMDTQLHDSELSNAPGDHVGIFPSNRKDIVNAILARLDPDASQDPDVLCKMETLLEKTTVLGTFKQWGEYERLATPISVRIALTNYLDITTPPTPVFLKQLASIAKDDLEKKKLQSLASTQKVYEEWKHRLTPTLAEVLAEFPSVRPCATLVLSQLPLLQPRFYSISSSPRMFPGEIHATVAVVTYRTQDGVGPVHYGVCSTWLNKLQEGDIVPCFVRAATSFHLPEDRSAPIIMVGPGTGIAPFRSFWQQRRVEMDMETNSNGRPSWGPMTLYFGCRYAHVDNVYGEETSVAVSDGVLAAVHTALSRQPGQPKTYVQDLLEANGKEVAEYILKKGGHFYVCGDVTMAAQVCATLEAVLAHHGNMTSEQAREHVIRMKERTRFHEDIFGTLRIAQVRDVIKVQTSKLPDLGLKRRPSLQNGALEQP